jgi:predicted nucleic acid-binding protein
VSSPVAFLDTNVILRHVLRDHPAHSPAAMRLIGQLESGDLSVRVADTVIFESVFTLEKTYRVPRPEIASALLSILDSPGVDLPGKSSYPQVFTLWLQNKGLPFADCFHAVCAMRFTEGVVISFDQDFDRIPGIDRREPGED